MRFYDTRDASGFSAALQKGNNRGHVILCPVQWRAAEKKIADSVAFIMEMAVQFE